MSVDTGELRARVVARLDEIESLRARAESAEKELGSLRTKVTQADALVSSLEEMHAMMATRAVAAEKALSEARELLVSVGRMSRAYYHASVQAFLAKHSKDGE